MPTEKQSKTQLMWNINTQNSLAVEDSTVTLKLDYTLKLLELDTNLLTQLLEDQFQGNILDQLTKESKAQ